MSITDPAGHNASSGLVFLHHISICTQNQTQNKYDLEKRNVSRPIDSYPGPLNNFSSSNCGRLRGAQAYAYWCDTIISRCHEYRFPFMYGGTCNSNEICMDNGLGDIRGSQIWCVSKADFVRLAHIAQEHGFGGHVEVPIGVIENGIAADTVTTSLSSAVHYWHSCPCPWTSEVQDCVLEGVALWISQLYQLS